MNLNSAPPSPILPLREWAYVHTELQWIYDHEVSPAYRNVAINTEKKGYRAWFIRRGIARITDPSGQQYEAGPGMWLLLPLGQLHQHFSDDAKILSLRFICQWPSGESLLSGGGGAIQGSDHPLLESLASELEKLVRKNLPAADTYYFGTFSDYEHFLSFHTLFLQWLAVWFSVQKELGASLTRLSADDDRLLRAVRCLNNAPLSQGLPRQALRLESGLGDAHLNRLFLAEYGMTIRKNWEQRRLNHAKSCLETSRMPVKEIAYSLGFKSDSHFMMWFKQRTAKRPKEYRDVHRSSSEG